MKPLIIDVREPKEYNQGHVLDAVNIPLSSLSNSSKLAGISKSQPLVLYCQSGNRSEQAIRLLQKRGYTNLTNGVSQEHIESQQ